MNNRESKLIIIAGYYGFGNTGDEAILTSILADFRKLARNLEFLVISASPIDTMEKYGVRSVYWKDIAGLIDAVQECDLVIVGGGGLFHDYWGMSSEIVLTQHQWGIPYYKGIALLTRILRKPFMIYSVGVGPLITDEGKRLTREIFDLADVVTVRDQESKALLGSIGVDENHILICPDPAINLVPCVDIAGDILVSKGLPKEEHPVIGVCIRNWTQGDDDAWKQKLSRALDALASSINGVFVFIPFQIQENILENDHLVAQGVVDLMQNKDKVIQLTEVYAPDVVKGLISHCDLILGMRLHSLIFAAGEEKSEIALVYDPKVRSFMESIGLSDQTLDLKNLDEESLVDLVTATLAKKSQLERGLSLIIGEQKFLTQKSVARALELLAQDNIKGFQPYEIELINELALKQTRLLAERDRTVQELESQLKTLRLHLGELQQQLDTIFASRGWKSIVAFRKIKEYILPAGSWMERFAEFSYRIIASLFHISKRSIVHIRQSIRRNGFFLAFLKGFRFIFRAVAYQVRKLFLKRTYDQRLNQLEVIITVHQGFVDLFHVPMGWKTMGFQRFQQLSIQMSRLGGLALYGGHPNVDKSIIVYEEVEKNLVVFDATDQKVLNVIIRALEKRTQPRLLRIESIDLVTTVVQVNDYIAKGFIVVYEYIDEITSDITGDVPDLVHERHEALLKDERIIVVTTSDQLFEKACKYRKKNIFLSTNGVDLDHWKKSRDNPPQDIRSALNGNIVVGYHGALAKWIDYDLLKMIADDGRYELVLIGFEHDQEFKKSGLKEHPKIHFIGSKSYFDLNSYVVYYDVAILPFRIGDFSDSVSPVKIFEYMAAQKPIVTTNLRECRKYQSCIIAATKGDFLSKLEIAYKLKDDPDYLGILAREANENSWRKKATEILGQAGIEL